MKVWNFAENCVDGIRTAELSYGEKILEEKRVKCYPEAVNGANNSRELVSIIDFLQFHRGH